MAKVSGHQAVVVSLKDLADSSVPFETLEAAFGPSSLGILIVNGLPSRYLELRAQLLSDASYLARLSPEELEKLTCAEAKYLSGWSHGKEALKTGSYDTLKGSYYVNCAFYNSRDGQGEISESARKLFPEFTAPNVWPTESSLPGFRKTFEELCTIVIDTAALVARACDLYAKTYIEGYKPGYLEHVVRSSLTTKARLLHYFPPAQFTETDPSKQDQRVPEVTNGETRETDDQDSWCATHVDHGCLTGLTSAVYIDEATHFPEISAKVASSAPSHSQGSSSLDTTAPSKLPVLPNVPTPSPETGLYIHARDNSITKISIPPDCLAFQTGEALQLITGGRFRAVPHFVRAVSAGSTFSSSSTGSSRTGPQSVGAVARNTLAVFTQPNLDEIVDWEKGLTFGEFSKEVVGRFS